MAPPAAAVPRRSCLLPSARPRRPPERSPGVGRVEAQRSVGRRSSHLLRQTLVARFGRLAARQRTPRTSGQRLRLLLALRDVVPPIGDETPGARGPPSSTPAARRATEPDHVWRLGARR